MPNPLAFHRPRRSSRRSLETPRTGPRVGAVLLGLLAVVPAPLQAQSPIDRAVLWGRVVDAESGDAVVGTEVRVEPEGLQLATDDRGRFRFEGLRPGRHVVVSEHLGFVTRTDTVAVTGGESLEIVLPLGRSPVELEGLEVEVTRRSLLLEMRGFYDRSRQGFRGTFLDRGQIEERDPLFVTDLLRNIPGVEVMADSRLVMSQSVTLYEGGRGCEPSLWLDGIRSGWRHYDDIKPDHLEGLEVYTGGGAPEKYNDLCGTVVIWTRLPMRGG